MIIIMAVLTLALIVALGAFFLISDRYIKLVADTMESRDVDHAKCIAHMAHYTGNQFAANVLRAAAKDYASPEGQHEVKVILNREQGGRFFAEAEPIPALWMRERAGGLESEVGL